VRVLWFSVDLSFFEMEKGMEGRVFGRSVEEDT
jgi:hypothetical protein